MSELAAVLTAYRDAMGCDVAVWSRPRGAAAPRYLAGRLPLEELPCPEEAPAHLEVPGGVIAVERVAGIAERVWLGIGPCPDLAAIGRHRDVLRPVVAHYLRASREMDHAAEELAERYEEINLLYATSEILGRTVTLEEAAGTILTEIAETVGARRAAILVHDRVTDTLQAVAARGPVLDELLPIATDDACAVSAQVFRDRRVMMVEDGERDCEAEVPYRRGRMLAVPILWSQPGAEALPLGVVCLSDRREGVPFSAGDQKLVAAIATQIGTAVQNARLVRASLAQQRLQSEMQLAHDLQMRLLPDVRHVAPDAQVAARVVPAESVGGDFYNLVRIGPGRTVAMIGDVSSHGYRAALIMALALSASTIHAQHDPDPGTALASLATSLSEELESTEMFITMFHGVVDREAGVLRYANTGHPHAFHVASDGTWRRLEATDPPLGMTVRAPATQEIAWKAGEDILLLFTDGISDARDRRGARLGEDPVIRAVVEHRAEAPAVIVERVFDVLRGFAGDVPQLDDLTLLVLRS